MELNKHERKLLELLAEEKEGGYGAAGGWVSMGTAYERCGEHLSMYGVSDFDRAYEFVAEAGLAEKSDNASIRATVAGVALVRTLKRLEAEASQTRKRSPARYWMDKILDNAVATIVGSAVGAALTLLAQSCFG